jgi:hypothetical protein
MDSAGTETNNDCAGEDHQQFIRQRVCRHGPSGFLRRERLGDKIGSDSNPCIEEENYKFLAYSPILKK